MITKEQIIKEIARIAKEENSRTLSRSKFLQKAKISEWHILKYFDNWNDAVSAAGLVPTDVSKINENDLWEEMYRVFVESGGIIKRQYFEEI